MGASGWDYRVRFADSVEATLRRLQEQLLDNGDYLWPWEGGEGEPVPAMYADYFEVEESEDIPRPSSLAELNTAKEVEEFWDEGTHTILDMDHIAAASDDGVGGIRPLIPEELNQVFGSVRPSAADFDRVWRQDWWAGPLGDLLGERWTGRSLVIYEDDTPSEVYFWGFSGD